MASFFGKLKSGASPTSPSIGASPSRKDAAAQSNQTPLERMLMNAGPIRNDGSDKFFGMENFGNTCYCNSILQCLYYSVPFRENVLSYPRRSPLEQLTKVAATALPRPPYSPQLANGAAKKPPTSPNARNPGAPPSSQPPKPEDKESPEYKKKQALMAGPILNMSYQNSAGYDMPESLFTALKDVFEAVVANQSRSGVVSPQKFLEVLRKENEMFRSSMHQDAHEFLNLLLNAVVENVEAYAKKMEAEKAEAEKDPDMAMNGHITTIDFPKISFPSTLTIPKNGSGTPNTTRWVHELFEGTLTSETRCLTCENISHRDEPFLDLSVDLDQHTSVTSCLRRFSEEEMLCERNKFHCDNCGGLQEAEKRMKIKRLPRILALHLKRFKYTEDLQRLQKLFHRIVYPYHLRLFNTTDDAEDPDRLYELYAVVVHIGGGPYHGHYVAIIKTRERGWLLFDDEMVEPVEKSYVRNFFGDRPGLACAYVLFYQETTIEDVRREQQMEGKARTSVDETAGLIIRTIGSAELHRVQTANSPQSPEEAAKVAVLDHALTAPELQAHTSSAIASPASPQIPSLMSALSPNIHFRREKAKEEKDRRFAEKEKEKAEKQKRKEQEVKSKEAQRKHDTDFKAALEASKLSKVEDDKRTGAESISKENATQNGTILPGFERFKRSKSLKFGSLGKKDKIGVLEEDVSAPALPDSTPEKDKERRSRFSIRKKSFSMLS